MIEILAPAGGREQLEAAVLSGADAVYLGSKNFNARRNAGNFEESELSDTVSYCHSHNVKVHVTLNTLITDDEIPAVIEEIKYIAESGADAVIVQDLAVAKLVRENVPSLSMHASTQMTIHNLNGVLAAKKLGFSRVVLSRELSFEEIKYICANTDMEIEIFVHGALCMCMSGACYLSSIIGGRSGNRGLCAQPCRLDFNYNGKDHALSLKDMSYINRINELKKLGVVSLKIEGRMKRPEYVAAAVNACRNALEGKSPDMDTLKAVFSRQGFTDGYLTGRRTYDMFGYRSYDDVISSEKVLKELRTLYKAETGRIPVDMRLFLSENKESSLTVIDGNTSITVTGEKCEKAVRNTTDYDTCLKYLSKTGSTPFFLKNLTYEADGSPFVSAGYLNSMRRNALDLLYVEKGKKKDSVTGNFVLEPFDDYQNDKTRMIFVRALDFKQLSLIDKADRYILPADIIIGNPDMAKKYSGKLTAEISPILFVTQEKRLDSTLECLKSIGINNVMTDNIGAMDYAVKKGFSVHGGYGLNILNSISLEEYRKLGLEDAVISFELSAAKIQRLRGSIKRGIISYGFLPLMKTRACPLKSPSGCNGCSGKGIIKDRYGNGFNYICSDKCYGTLLNSVPLYVSDKNIRGIDFEMLYFTTENPERCGNIFNMAFNRENFDSERTNGLYYRNLL